MAEMETLTKDLVEFQELINNPALGDAVGIPTEAKYRFIKENALDGCPPALVGVACMGLEALGARDYRDELTVKVAVESEMGKLRMTDSVIIDKFTVSSHLSGVEMVEEVYQFLNKQSGNIGDEMILAFAATSGIGKDYLIRCMKEDNRFKDYIEVSFGSYFRALTRALVLYEATYESLNINDIDKVNAFFERADLKGYIEELLAQGKIKVETEIDTKAQHAIAKCSVVGSDSSLEKIIGGLELNGFVAKVAAQTQIRAVEYANSAIKTIHDQGLKVLVQGRDFTIKALGQKIYQVEVINKFPWQVGLRRARDILVKAILARRSDLKGKDMSEILKQASLEDLHMMNQMLIVEAAHNDVKTTLP